jgi:uncharacterized membrane protein
MLAFLDSLVEFDWGSVHPVLLHFPIVLFCAALICDLLNGIGKPRALVVGHWMVIIGAIFCLPTILTGLAAAENFDPNDVYVFNHKWFGIATGIFAALYSVLRIGVLFEKWTFFPLVYVFCSVILVSLTLWTSDYGGLITRGKTPFSSREEFFPSKPFTDPEEVASYNPQELSQYLSRKISVENVIPIFTKYGCGHCHADNFIGGRPHNFSTADDPNQIFLPRNPDGSLNHFETSSFYKMVILNNKMPLKDDESQGISLADRFILLQWLENGAPEK